MYLFASRIKKTEEVAEVVCKSILTLLFSLLFLLLLLLLLLLPLSDFLPYGSRDIGLKPSFYSYFSLSPFPRDIKKEKGRGGGTHMFFTFFSGGGGGREGVRKKRDL